MFENLTASGAESADEKQSLLESRADSLIGGDVESAHGGMVKRLSWASFVQNVAYVVPTVTAAGTGASEDADASAFDSDVVDSEMSLDELLSTRQDAAQ
ncbi:hypothetical protein [Halorubellus litoreus]|uniref:Uncharacterized protein n=1 Tax=Halorubellus litoreus TaxID=755308 RepID=A0ABD5VDL3_9EURY